MNWRMMVVGAGMMGLIALAAERGLGGQVAIGTPGGGHVISAPMAGRVISPPVLWHAPQGNGHLHLGTPVKVSKKTEIKSKAVEVHRHWHTRWDFAGWVRLHRGLGTVVGTVQQTSAGSGDTVTVWLRRPGGRAFSSAAAKHSVHTSVGGEFTMGNVRMGSYRLMASAGKKKSSHVQIRVNSGAMTQVTVGV